MAWKLEGSMIGMFMYGFLGKDRTETAKEQLR
jgi:hypothetical protein